MSETTSEMQRILSIARSIAGETGHQLLTSLVGSLSQNLNASFVAITYGEGQPATRARTLFAIENNAIVENISYDLNGTPCARVYQGETVTIPCRLADIYPKESDYEGYIGIPLRDKDGRVMGHLLILSDDVIRASDVATAVAQIFSVRAEAELNRITEESHRQKLISDLSALNARLQRGYSTLHRETAEKSSLMGLIAHDLRSPLSAIISQAELGQTRLQAGGADTSRLATGFSKIIDNADRMTALIEATLERARGESAALQINAHPCDLAGLTNIAVASNHDEAKRKNIALLYQPTSHIRVQADEVLMVSAIDNLISNAVKYTHSGGRVEVTLGTNSGRAEICICDTGQGLTEDDRNRAFGRFQRLSAKPTGGETSTGLGLSNVREIVVAHHGEVNVHSDGRDTGSRFSILLPLLDGTRRDDSGLNFVDKTE